MTCGAVFTGLLKDLIHAHHKVLKALDINSDMKFLQMGHLCEPIAIVQ